MIKAGIVGATGYAGAELARLLYMHPETELVWPGSKSYEGQGFADVYRNLTGFTGQTLKADDLSAMADECDVVFTATPQGYLSQNINKEMLQKAKFIDLSADFRIRDVKVYEAWYGLTHGAPELLPEAVYGLSELYADDIINTRLLANPGCYTTCSILTLYPLCREGIIDTGSIVIDAKSGTSGAGRGAKTQNLFCEVNENVKAYSVSTHRHTPEIEQELSVASGENVVLNFTPHLIPMNRGILVTAYARTKTGELPTWEEIKSIYEKYYGNCHFLRFLEKGICPETRWVENSNFVDMNVVPDTRTGRLILMGALDNLVKGAAGQAVQNMNLMFSLPETTGLEQAPVFP